MCGSAKMKVGFLTEFKERFWAGRYAFLYLVAAALFLSIWHSRVTHQLSLRAFAIFVALCVLSLIYGRPFIKLIPFSFKANGGFSMQFLCGYLVLSTVLLFLSLFTPFGIATNVFILVAVGLLILLFCPRAAKDIRKPVDCLPDFLCLLLSGTAATLWCTDLLSGVVSDGQNMVYPIYVDGFVHVRQISSFAQAHGLKTIFDIRMSGQSPPLYHYAAYVGPAALSFLTNSSAYTTYVSFLVPFGILLTGLAAFSLAGSVWGAWPGLAATLAVTLLPDAYQQGFGNKFLSYNFFQQAAPGGSYGVACVAIAWIFILDGCKGGKLASIITGYAVLLISIVYKAHFFVANAFLLMIYPCVFFRGLRMSWRIISAILLTSLFGVVVSLSQHLEGVPTLRLDGTGVIPYARALLGVSEPGVFKSFFPRVLGWRSTALLDFSLACFIVLSTFGLWTIALFLVPFLGRMKIGAVAFFFPFLVVANYLVMSMGLASDTKGIGRPEELLHRPFVWAYFVVVAWAGAGVYTYLIGNHPPRSRFARILAALFALSSFLVPLVCARNIQTFRAFKGMASYRMFNSVPSGLIKACVYIRKHSEIKDIIQDSENDPKWVITALAERQAFVACDPEIIAHLWNNRPPEVVRDRLKELAACKKITDETGVTEFMQKHQISWYILQPGSEVAWPTSFLGKAVFHYDGYRVFHFSHNGHDSENCSQTKPSHQRQCAWTFSANIDAFCIWRQQVWQQFGEAADRSSLAPFQLVFYYGVNGSETICRIDLLDLQPRSGRCRKCPAHKSWIRCARV